MAFFHNLLEIFKKMQLEKQWKIIHPFFIGKELLKYIHRIHAFLIGRAGSVVARQKNMRTILDKVTYLCTCNNLALQRLKSTYLCNKHNWLLNWVKGAVYVLYFWAVGSRVKWFFSCWGRKNCLQSWANLQNDNYFNSNGPRLSFLVKIVVSL